MNKVILLVVALTTLTSFSGFAETPRVKSDSGIKKSQDSGVKRNHDSGLKRGK